MASIDHPRGKDRVRWRDPDGTPRARTCKTKAAAKALLAEVQAAEDTGRRWEPRGLRAIVGIREVAKAWLGARARKRLAPRTLIRDGQMVEAFAKWVDDTEGKGVGLSVLSRPLLERYWDWLIVPETSRYQHGRGIATCRKYIEAVHALWVWTSSRDEYPDCPSPREIEMPEAEPAGQVIAPTWGEMDAAVAACTTWRRAVLLIMRCTGLRVQQVMALRWGDVDFPRARLTIRGELGKMRPERRGRDIPIPPVLLAEWRAPSLCVWDRADEWIVPCPHAHRLVRSRDIALVWRRAGVREVAWLGHPDHAFRIGYQTGLRAAGVDGDAVEWLVGHKLGGTKDPYLDGWAAFDLPDAASRVPTLAPMPSVVTAIRLCTEGVPQGKQKRKRQE